MRVIDSGALDVVQRQLGLTGKGSQEAVFEDGVAQQSFDIFSAVRRGQSARGDGGYFYLAMSHEHAGAGAISQGVNPYQVADAVVFNEWPGNDGGAGVTRNFDVWIESVGLERTDAGAGVMARPAVVRLTMGTSSLGIGIDGAGAVLEATGSQMIAMWDGLVTVAGAIVTAVNLDTNEMVKKLGFRMPRSGTLQFITDMDAAVDMKFTLAMMLVPVAMGSDYARW